ncbi:MAG: Gfo/Idh/MocA family protein [Acidimicrobiales bacterium]
MSGDADRVRVGAIGLGRWGRVLASAYRESDVVELGSCFTRDPTRRRRFAEDFGCDEDDSLEALLARPDIEGIIVTVPNDQHAPVIEAAASAGKHVYVEKPLAVDPADIRRIRRAVVESGVVFSCGHSARRLSGLREIRRLVDSGEIGAPSLVEAAFANERGLDLKDGDWRADPFQCPGGPLTQLGVHQIDNLSYLFGTPNRVVGVGRQGSVAVKNVMAVAALLEFDGVIGYLGVDWLTPGAFTLDLHCSKARLRYELDFSWWSNSSDTDAHSRLTRVEISSDSDDPDSRVLGSRDVDLPRRDHLREEIDEFGRAVRGSGAIEVGLPAAVANVAVVLAIARSMERRCSVEVGDLVEELEG